MRYKPSVARAFLLVLLLISVAVISGLGSHSQAEAGINAPRPQQWMAYCDHKDRGPRA